MSGWTIDADAPPMTMTAPLLRAHPSQLTLVGTDGPLLRVDLNTGKVTLLSRDPHAMEKAAQAFWKAIEIEKPRCK